MSIPAIADTSPNPRRYRSPDDEPIRATLPDGRVALIGPEWRDLPRDFHNAAVREGAEVQSATGTYSARDEPEPKKTLSAPRAGTDEAVRTAMVQAIDDDPPGLINETTLVPDVAIISKYAGFTVSHEQNHRVFQALREEIEEANRKADAEEEARVRGEVATETAEVVAEREKRAAEAAAAEDKKDPNEISKAEALRRKAANQKMRQVKGAKRQRGSAMAS